MNEVQNFPILYDKFDREFKDIHKKRNAWNKVGDSFGLSAEVAAEKYKNIRSAYGRYLKKRKTTPSGSGRSTINLEYDYLEWLNVYIEHRETTSNLPSN